MGTVSSASERFRVCGPDGTDRAQKQAALAGPRRGQHFPSVLECGVAAEVTPQSPPRGGREVRERGPVRGSGDRGAGRTLHPARPAALRGPFYPARPLGNYFHVALILFPMLLYIL